MTLRDRHVFAAATAVVAIHTITDAFVAPEPGVELADHAVSGLVPLALLAGALACFWLNRERLSAVLALVLGVLALEGFALAVADARAVGVRGDDWTGFALAPAGLTLVAFGVRCYGDRGSTEAAGYLRRRLIAIAAIIGAYWVLVPVAIALIATHRPARRCAGRLGRASQPVTIRTADGLDLTAGMCPPGTARPSSSFPATGGRAAQARALVRQGYGVLMLDMRGYAGSDGDPNMFGWCGEGR